MRTKDFLIIGIFLGTALFAFIFSEVGGPTYTEDSESFNRDYWQHALHIRGSQDAYQEFLKKNSEAPAVRQHTASHIMGELLFDIEGKEGIRYCDSSFGFGCYHGLFSIALASESVSAISEFDRLCVEIYGPLGTGCQHGIGHGIMEFVGGDRVTEALELCKKTTQVATLLGCSSGVFMEYFTPLAGAGRLETPKSREIDLKHPHEPCPSTDPTFQDSCYFELGQSYGTRLPNQHEKQNELCSLVENNRFRDRCYMGLGLIASPLSGYDFDSVVSVCGVMREGEGACRAGAAWSFYSNPETRSQARSVCANPDAAKQQFCINLSDLTEGLEGKTQL